MAAERMNGNEVRRAEGPLRRLREEPAPLVQERPAPARPALGCGNPSLRPRSRCAARGRSQRSPPHAAPLTPPTARERLHWVAPRGLHHFAASRAVGSRCGLPNAPSGSPSEALRSPSLWAGKICIATYKPSFLRFARRNDLALRTGAGEGEPLATARSRRVMDRSLRLAPINRSRRQAASFA